MKTYQRKHYGRFVHAFIGFFFFLPAALGAFNYFMDPANRYQFSISEEGLRALSRSYNQVLSLPENYDDRALIKKFIRVTREPSVVLLGGSRIGNIQAEMFREPFRRELLNTSVSAGTIRDYVAIWQMVKQRKFRPKFVILGLEQQSLNSVSQNDKYLSIYEHYEAFFQRGLSARVKFMGLTTDLKDLLSLQTTMASWQLLFKKNQARGVLIPRSEQGEWAARTNSCSIIYPKDYESKPVELVNRWGLEHGMGDLKVFHHWNRSYRGGYDPLEALIQDIKKSGAVPVVFLAPYHPEAYRLIEQSPKAFGNMQVFVEEIRKIASAEEIFCYDAMIEHHSDFRPEDFSDGVHLKMAPNHRLLKKVDEEAGFDLVV